MFYRIWKTNSANPQSSTEEADPRPPKKHLDFRFRFTFANLPSTDSSTANNFNDLTTLGIKSTKLKLKKH
jgi:hypothetical protein